MEKPIAYQGAEVYVNQEVVDFLDQDRKKMQAQERQDRRHLSRSSFEQLEATTHGATDANIVFDLVWKRLQLQKLQSVMDSLTAHEGQLIKFYYMDEMSMKDIGTLMGGVSKMAVSKRLNKLLLKLQGLMET